METLQEKVLRLRNELAVLQAQEGNEAAINQKAIELHQVEDELKAAQITEQSIAVDASAVTIPRQYDFSVDFNDIFGTSILNDEIQKILDAQREQLHSYYMGLQEERDNTIREQRKEIDMVNEENKVLIVAKGQAELERDDFKKRFENAGELIKELESEVSRLKEREIELIETANKAPLLYPHKVIDVTVSNIDAGDAIREQRAKELAAKPKVWGLQWADELKKTEYKAVGEDGAEVIIKRLEVGKYNVQEGPRPEQVVAEVVAEDLQDSVTPEEKFLELPSIEAPNIPTEVQLVDGTPADSGQGGITKEEFESRIRQVKEEIKAELVTQYGLVKMAS